MDTKTAYEIGFLQALKTATADTTSRPKKNRYGASWQRTVGGALLVPSAVSRMTRNLPAALFRATNRLEPGLKGKDANALFQSLKQKMKADPNLQMHLNDTFGPVPAGNTGYIAQQNRISTPNSTIRPSTMAHEIGHASGANVLTRPRAIRAMTIPLRLGARLAPLAIFGQAFTDRDSTTSNVLKYGPAAMIAPALVEEARASARGLHALYKVKGLATAARGSLPLAAALGTYGALAAAPILGEKIMHHFTRPDQPPKREKKPA